MHPMLNIAIKAARRAGSIINRAALDRTRLEIRSKQANDFVTQVDRAAEAAIIDIIRQAYPDHAVLGEESGALDAKSIGQGKKADYRWIIDPLDGTMNYIHGLPQYCVSIGLQHRGAMEQGVIYDPAKNELFTASKGRGAFLDDRRIRVTKCANLKDALVGTGFPYRELPRLDLYCRQLREMMQSASGLRRTGSAALDLAYVAAGRLDGFWELGLAPWDVAAGALLVQEAGGLVGDLSGEADYLEGSEIAAATPKVFQQLLAALQ